MPHNTLRVPFILVCNHVDLRDINFRLMLTKIGSLDLKIFLFIIASIEVLKYICFQKRKEHHLSSIKKERPNIEVKFVRKAPEITSIMSKTKSINLGWRKALLRWAKWLKDKTMANFSRKSKNQKLKLMKLKMYGEAIICLVRSNTKNRLFHLIKHRVVVSLDLSTTRIPTLHMCILPINLLSLQW